MTEMVTSGSMSGDARRSDGLLGESGHERTPLAAGAAGPVRHRARPRLYQSGHEFSVGAAAPRSPGSRRTGIVNVKVEPVPIWLLTQIWPPCSSMNLGERASP